MTPSENDQLLRIPTIFQTRARILQALADRHRLVLLLGEPASLLTFLLHAASQRALASGRLVHPVAPERLRAQDLDHADRQVIVAIDRAADLSPQSLRALDAHLRARRPTQIILAGPPGCRALTRTLPALHHAPLVVPLPSLPSREAGAFLKLRGRAPNARLIAAAAGQASLLDRLAAARGLARLPEIAEFRGLAPVLDRPVALLAVSLGFAALAAGATQTGTRAVAHETAAAPPVAAFQPPPIDRRPPDTPARPVVAGSAYGPGPPENGVTVDREDPDDLLAPRHVTVRRGETLQSIYARIYRGLTPPPLSVVQALNPHGPRPGGRLTFPAPDEGWPGP